MLSIKELEQLNVGDVVYECAMGHNLKITIATKPSWINHDTQLVWQAIIEDQTKAIDYLVTIGFEHYGPKIYREPAYAEIPASR